MQALTTITWNCNGILSKLLDVKLLINEYLPQIIFINETHLTQKHQVNFPNYTTLRQDRHDGRGGIAIIIHKNVPYKELQIDINLGPFFQIMAVKVANINFVNIYCPPSIVLQTQEYNDILNIFQGPTMITGDLNTQHQMWGSTNNNLAGRRLQEAMELTNMIILNDGSRTRVTMENNSCPDLTIVTPDIAHKCNWYTHDNSCFSDHIPMITIIGDSIERTPIISQGRWNTKKACWDKYMEELSKEDSTNGYEDWKQQVLRAAKQAIPRVNRNITQNKYPPKPVWWDETCNIKLDERRKAFHSYKTLPNRENFMNYKQTAAKARRFFKNKRKNEFHKFCTTLNRESPISHIWSTVKKFSNSYHTKPHKPEDESHLINILNNLSQSDNPINITEDIQYNNNESIYSIELEEMKVILDKKKESAPGQDEISYPFLKNCTESHLTSLCTIYNKILQAAQKAYEIIQNMGLQISTEKTKAVIFTKGKLRNIPTEIKLNNAPIEWVNNYKYLGIVFDAQMSWTIHIDKCVTKAARGINIIKSLTKVWWGADPKILLTIYKGIVRTHLDFGMQCIFKASKANWNKLNRVQYQALRIVIGCMRSTPIRALLSESAEVPLEVRRRWLAAKLASKILSRTDDKITNELINMYTLFAENPQYWRNISTPAIVEGTDLIISYYNYIYKADKSPCFDFPYHQQISKLNFTKLNLVKDTHNERHFIHEIKEVAPEYTMVFTDASVEPSNHKCGIGIYSEELDIRVARKLTDFTAITSAETLAIREAIRLSKNKTHKLAVITDSLSALQAIKKQGVDKNQDYITLSTRAEIIAASQQGDIKLIWVPSHTGITGNDTADKLAQSGRNQNQIHQNNAVPSRSFLGLIKDQLWEQWAENYKNGHQNKGQYYADIQPNPQKIPWFYNLRFSNRAMISTIIRMRTNHCCTPAHLNKIGTKEDPNCICGEYGSLDHIIFNCNARPQLGNRCYLRALQGSKGPSNIKSLCTNPTSKEMLYIIQELIKSQIKI
nr:unnamed protein product [Callosobruchus chinensis]